MSAGVNSLQKQHGKQRVVDISINIPQSYIEYIFFLPSNEHNS